MASAAALLFAALPSFAGSAMSHLVCSVSDPSGLTGQDFEAQLCNDMAKALHAVPLAGTASHALQFGALPQGALLMELTVGLRKGGLTNAVLKTGTVSQWKDGATRRSPPVDVSMSDTNDYAAAVASLVQAAPFMLKNSR